MATGSCSWNVGNLEDGKPMQPYPTTKKKKGISTGKK